MPERVRQANLDAALFNNPLMEWMLDTLLPDSGAAEQIGVKREFREYGAVLYEHSKDRLYPNYLRWCRENGRESVSSRRFSESLLDAAQTQGAQVENSGKAPAPFFLSCASALILKNRGWKSCKPAAVKDWMKDQ